MVAGAQRAKGPANDGRGNLVSALPLLLAVLVVLLSPLIYDLSLYLQRLVGG